MAVKLQGADYFMVNEIFINGIEIWYHDGVNNENTINYLSSELTTGKTYLKPLGDLSKKLKFKSYLPEVSKESDSPNISNYHQVYLNLLESCRKQAVPIVIKDLSFKGRVIELTWDYGIEGIREYSWTIVEDADFKATPKTFNTFNYKAPTVTAKKTVTNAPSYIKALYKCSMKHDCTKKKISCVTHLQKLLQSDGFYRKYVVDGWWCTYTTQEFKKWQKKKAKVKVTGKFDKTTKAYLKKRFSIGYILGESLKFTSAAKNPLK